MNDFVIKPVDIFEIFKRQRWVILISFMLTFGSVVGLALVLPKTYQGEAIFHIAVSYFQNPLIGNLVSQTADPNELRSERERIIQSSLDSAFANRVGQKMNLFKSAAGCPERALDIEWILKNIDISAVTSTQFKLTYRSRIPADADQMVRECLDGIREHMYQNRITTMQQLISVLDTEIGRAQIQENRGGVALEGGSTQSRIQDLKKRIDELKRTFSESHPGIAALRSQLIDLQNAQKLGGMAPNLVKKGLFQKPAEGAATIKDDLNKQKHLVNIALEIERKDQSMTSYLSLIREPTVPKNPVFPKFRLFILFALVAGVLVSTFAAALIEFHQRENLKPEDFARQIKAPVFGTIILYPEKNDHR